MTFRAVPSRLSVVLMTWPSRPSRVCGALPSRSGFPTGGHAIFWELAISEKHDK
jgi:hypothetical protein